MSDYAQSPYMGIKYYENVVARMGKARANDVIRLYTAPNVDHVGTGAPAYADLLTTLENWVQRKQAPDTLEAVDFTVLAQATRGRTLPLCQYPQYPKYKGAGDMTKAANFACSN